MFFLNYKGVLSSIPNHIPNCSRNTFFPPQYGILFISVDWRFIPQFQNLVWFFLFFLFFLSFSLFSCEMKRFQIFRIWCLDLSFFFFFSSFLFSSLIVFRPSQIRASDDFLAYRIPTGFQQNLAINGSQPTAFQQH